MSDSSSNPITPILEYLYLSLRYIASGFVAVGVYFLLNPEVIEKFKDQSWLITFLAAMIGIFMYSLHFATLDKIFYGWCTINFLKKNNKFLPDILIAQINEWENKKDVSSNFDIQKIIKANLEKPLIKFKPFKIDFEGNNKLKRHILFAFANQAYFRHVSKDREIKFLQKQVESRVSLLNFLYCSSYQIICLTIYFSISNFYWLGNIDFDKLGKIIFLFAIGILAICCAIRFNRRICSREMWLIYKFPQHKINEDEPQKTKSSRLLDIISNKVKNIFKK